MYQNYHEMYQTAIKYLYQHLSLQDTPKFAQIGIFGLEIYYLATLTTIGTPDRGF
jgi:hypothetical protein